jgi:hypothetical protein
MTTIDRIEVLLDRTVALLLVKFPVRTGLGVAIGGALSLVVRILEPLLRSIPSIDVGSVPWWGWISLGVVLMHAPTIKQAFAQRPLGNVDVDLVLDLIERAKLPPAETRQQYRLLIEEVRRKLQVAQHRSRADSTASEAAQSRELT